jgi:SPP1 family predicted phage head-tail adaptor
MTRIGDMDKSITFQTATETSDGMGAGGTLSWANTLTTWAAIRPLRGRELLSEGKLEHTVTHRVFCWYSALINAKQRISYDSRAFQIISIINPNEENVEMEILVEEIDA